MPEAHKKKEERRVKRVKGHSMNNMVKRGFEAAHIPYTIRTQAGRWGGPTFAIDIVSQEGGKNEDTDVVSIFFGTESKVAVDAFDAKAKQLVLSVHTPERQYEVTERVWNKKELQYESKKKTVTEEQKHQWYLVGYDESKLFIRPLPRAAKSVVDAHSIMLPTELKNTPKAGFKRQGQFFFKKASETEVQGMMRSSADEDKVTSRLQSTENTWWSRSRGLGQIGVGTGSVRVHRRVRLGMRLWDSAERAPVVDSLVSAGAKEYAKGKVTHPDYQTKKLSSWHRVYEAQKPKNKY